MMNGGGAWFLAGRKKVPITLVNSALSLTNQTTTATFSNLEYGAPSGANRFVVVCITGEETTNGLIDVPSVTWGGTALSFIERGGGSTSGVAIIAEMWAGFVTSGSSGNLVIGLNKTASSTENWDSIAVSTLVTNTISSGTRIDAGDYARVGGGSTDTASNLQTSSGGFIVAVGASTAEGFGFSGVAGNGSNGALTELVDVEIASDHQHAVYLLDDTTSQTTEDFTMTNSISNAAAWGGAIASWL
ncbi:MAG: hypothetical protein AAF414_17205 [Pseudomonadota bacterium]